MASKLEVALEKLLFASRWILAPIFLGAGERLFEDVGDLAALEHVRTVAAPGVTHLKFVKR